MLKTFLWDSGLCWPDCIMLQISCSTTNLSLHRAGTMPLWGDIGYFLKPDVLVLLQEQRVWQLRNVTFNQKQIRAEIMHEAEESTSRSGENNPDCFRAVSKLWILFSVLNNMMLLSKPYTASNVKPLFLH